jgi:hypothetical protein
MHRRTFLFGLLCAGSALAGAQRFALAASSPSTGASLTVDFHSHAWRRQDFRPISGAAESTWS